MENQMQNESIDSGIYSNMELTSQAIASLNETRKWTMFLSILSFIFLGFFLLIMIVSLFMTSLIPVPGAQVGPIMILPFLIIIAIYFFPIYFLFQFSVFSKKAIATKNPSDLEQAMGYLRSYYRFIGILSIIMISLCLIIFLFVGLAAAFFR